MKIDREKVLTDLVHTYGLITVVQDLVAICKETAREEEDEEYPHIAERWWEAANALTAVEDVCGKVV